MLIGVNDYLKGTDGQNDYRYTSMHWATAPPSGTVSTCPSPSAFKSGTNNYNNGVNWPYVSTPAHQTDPSTVGYILNANVNGGSALRMWKVTSSATGTPIFTGLADAPQGGTSDYLATLDPGSLRSSNPTTPQGGAESCGPLTTCTPSLVRGSLTVK
jgi:hypothetical protein